MSQPIKVVVHTYNDGSRSITAKRKVARFKWLTLKQAWKKGDEPITPEDLGVDEYMSSGKR